MCKGKLKRVYFKNMIIGLFWNVLSHVWLFATLWTIDCQATLTMGFFRQEHWSGLPFLTPGDLLNPGIETTSLVSPALQVDSLPLCHLGSPWLFLNPTKYFPLLRHLLFLRSSLTVQVIFLLLLSFRYCVLFSRPISKGQYIAQFSSVAQSCLTLCVPMDCSMPGFPVNHQLLELAQTHVHRVGDAIQSSHPL